MQPTQTKPNIEYPSTDSQPMAQNTKQYRWIVTIQGGLAALFRDRPDVFVAGDLFWYPVEGNNQLCAAPDVMVVFGRPKGDRDSYRQWEEDGIPPQVVFEIASGSNTSGEWVNKTLFYERFGVQEFYIYDPEKNTLEGYIRGADGHLQPVEQINGWISPLLGVKFELQGDELIITTLDGRRFQVYEELAAAFDHARQLLEQERQRAEQERQRAEQERQRAERLAQKLRELGVEPD
ncbi:MAG: Uma2 family endonuclease [Fimbriimonadales bacterium]|nr:Uma2 family endonuclease [Fimbriimonadales bacterium]